jgi:hypothetical protein
MEFDGVDFTGMSALDLMAARQQATERALMELAGEVKALGAQLAELKTERSAERREIESSSIAAVGDEEPVAPETAAVIVAAATAFMGTDAKQGSTKSAHATPDAATAWSQQGRVVVQTSHNFRSRG